MQADGSISGAPDRHGVGYSTEDKYLRIGDTGFGISWEEIEEKTVLPNGPCGLDGPFTRADWSVGCTHTTPFWKRGPTACLAKN
jgi:hypothetical protein